MSVHYKFEWNPETEELNHGKHGVRFEEAATVFRDPMAVTVYDPDHSESEDRWITMGISIYSRILIVCHTFKEESTETITLRIFSSRRANKNEIQKYGAK